MSGETKVHDFQERLQFSTSHVNEPFWLAVYAKAFPNMECAMPVTEKSQGQYLGIDRVIYLHSGKTLYVDEKLRESDYPDIALEYISNDQTNSPGWIEKELLIDYIAYAFLPSRRCYLFDWLMLRRAWIEFKAVWLAEYFLIPAKNSYYTTWSVAVPTDVLLKAVKNASIIQL